MTKLLVDTGPLVAFLNERDRYHDWTVEQLSDTQPPLLTCEAVLTEAFFLLRRHKAGTEALIKLIDQRIVSVAFRLDEEHARVGSLIRRYSNLPISLADACLVRMSEIFSDCRLFTFDGDFQVYRRNGRQVIPTICPTR
jgi:predicted nucleic acid-binding protein